MTEDKKISDLTPNPSIDGTEEVPTEKGGVNLKNTYIGVRDWMSGYFAQKSNVLELDNTTVFSPSNDYQPATRKFVLDNSGGGSGVNSVTGDGVSGTPDNVILTFPNTSEVSESTDKNYVTDSDKVLLSDTSGVNTGDQDLSAKADKATLLQSGGNVSGSINTDANTFTLNAVGGSGNLVEGNVESIKGGSTSSFNTFNFNTVLGLGNTEALGEWAQGFGNLLKVPQSSTYMGYQLGNTSRQNDSQVFGQRIPEVGRGCVYVGYRINDFSTDKASAFYQNVVIGRDITFDATNHKRTVAIGSLQVFGNGAGELTGTTLIGHSASSFVDPVFGNSGTDNTGIGNFCKPHSWRATALGAYAFAAATSATCIGMGSYANKAHGLTIGRGGYNDRQNASLIYQSGNVPQNYFGAMHAAHTNIAMPGNETIDFSAELNAGIYVSTFTTVDGLDVRPVPSLTDTRGGHIRIGGGVSTGNALGGEIRFATSPASLVGGTNIINGWTEAAKFDAEMGVDSRFWLLDVTDNILKRVQFGSDDSAGTGFKTLKIAN